MTRRPLLLLATILLALLVAVFILGFWVGLLRGLDGASTPVGQNAARTTPSAASRALARPVLPASPDPAADQPAGRAISSSPEQLPGKNERLGDGSNAPSLDSARLQDSVAAQGPSVVAGEGATLGPSAYEKLRAAISWCESRNQPTVVNKTSGAAGLFQFMPRTWEAVTGLKPPASAYSVAIQTAAFDALYKLRGTQPWDSSRSCWK